MTDRDTHDILSHTIGGYRILSNKSGHQQNWQAQERQ